jgi:hypothetical protein
MKNVFNAPCGSSELLDVLFDQEGGFEAFIKLCEDFFNAEITFEGYQYIVTVKENKNDGQLEFDFTKGVQK